MNVLRILRMVSILAMFLGGFIFLTLIPAFYFNELHSIRAYILSGIIVEVIGAGLYKFTRDVDSSTLLRREAIATVAFSWLAVGLLGAIPYVMDGAIPTYIDAFFETVSGFTTTGSTILPNIESLSKTSLFWRSLTHWLGGMGIIVLFIAIFPQLGVGAKHLFKSEVPGPITEGLRPKIKETSSALWKIYFGLTFLLMFLLWLAGMPVFDSVTHAFATLATGGFSIKNASIKFYDSMTIDFIITIFMILAGINFSLYFLIFNGRYKAPFKDSELKTYLSIIGIATFVLTFVLLDKYSNDILQAFRYASFQVAAIITTTGFATDDFNIYPPLGKIILLSLMFIGGSAGSTSGGMKVSRVVIAVKASFFEVYKTFRPHYVRSLKVSHSKIPPDIVRGIFAFVIVFIFILFLGTVFVASFGIDIVTSFTSVLTALGNVGPGLERVGSVENFAFMPSPVKFVLSICMILGRLELYTILVMLIPDFWKK
jgi:trk system potassium uptake protein TrkH